MDKKSNFVELGSLDAFQHKHIWRTQPIWAGAMHFPPLCCSFHRYLSQEESTDDAPGQVGRRRGAPHNTSKGVCRLAVMASRTRTCSRRCSCPALAA